MADYWKEINQPPPVETASTTEFLVPTNAKLVRQMRTGATWLVAFAAFTAANDVLGHIDAPIRMVLGLIASEYVIAIAHAIGNGAILVGYALSALMLLTTAAIGVFAYRLATWAFWAGLAVIGVDAIINYFVTTLQGIWPFLFHLAAMWSLYLGLKAARLHAQRRFEGKA